MRKSNQKGVVFFIGTVILVTLAIQIYWNINNYRANKAVLTNEVLSVLTSSVDSYYSELIRTDIITIDRSATVFPSAGSHTITMEADSMEDLAHVLDSIKKQHGLEDSTVITTVSGTGRIKPVMFQGNLFNAEQVITQADRSLTTLSLDSLSRLTQAATKVIASMFNQDIDLKKLSGYVKEELGSKGFDFDFALSQLRGAKVIHTFNDPEDPKYSLSVASGSAYLARASTVRISFPDITLLVLKKSFLGLFLSLLLSVFTIACLFYLLKIINEQKQIMLSKNDFISNISHELKTPITTSMSALEGIQHFNRAQDPEKTRKYLTIASGQLRRLSILVEKILETVSLDTNRLTLVKEDVDLTGLVGAVVEKQRINTTKEIIVDSPGVAVRIMADPFHLENVVSNIVENAIKYGGERIRVTIRPGYHGADVFIADNGKTIERHQGEKIFEKFYRIPTHNQHDIKGYGIGLYNSRIIIEKHKGTLVWLAETRETTFKITLPYE